MSQTHADSDHIDLLVSAEVTVANVASSGRSWLQAADVIVGQHNTRCGARRWVRSIRRQYPGCAVAVSRSRHDRWLVLGWPGLTMLVRGGPFGASQADEAGRLVYLLWASGRGGRS